jgi:hypothetical protein
VRDAEKEESSPALDRSRLSVVINGVVNADVFAIVAASPHKAVPG